MKKYLIFFITIILFSCNSTAQKKKQTDFKISKTEAEWRTELSKIEFNVLRKEGTEQPFSSPLNKNYKEGIYHCKACNTPLFKSEHKFDSGTGWPSFDRKIYWIF